MTILSVDGDQIALKRPKAFGCDHPLVWIEGETGKVGMSILNNVIASLIAKQVHLEILRKSLEWDRHHLHDTKMYNVYNLLLDRVIKQISDDLYRIKNQLQKQNATIVSEKQEPEERIITYRHQGYVFESRYSNQLIKVKCEQLFQSYLKL